MSTEPLQRQKQINEACSDTLIFFLGSFFGAFFSWPFFRIIFFVLSSEPLQRQKHINEAWSHKLIFFLGSFYWAFFFLGNFFGQFFMIWVLSPCRGRSRSARPGRILWYQAHCPHHALHIMGQLRWAAFSWKISSSYCRADLNLSHPREMFRPNLQNFLDSQQNTIKTAFKFLHACTLEAKLCSR